MFSALKFVVAGVIVALFGGFLLAGVFTTQQDGEVLPAAVTESPGPEVTSEPTEAPTISVRTDILPGVTLTVEEVELGVFRVIDDGVRDLTKANNANIVAGHDGGIWLARKNRFFRLGSEDTHTGPEQRGVPRFEVAPDGTVWAMTKGGLHSVGRGSDDWTLMTGDAPYSGPLEVTSDGAVWAQWRDDPEDPERWVLGYLGADGWQAVGEWPDEWPDGWPDEDWCSKVGRCAFLVSDRGEVWALAGSTGPRDVQHFVDGAWRTYDEAEDLRGSIRDAAVGADGTLWGSTRAGFFRFDGTEWTTFEPHDGFPVDVFGWGTSHVAPDGALWVAPRLKQWECGRDRCSCHHGVARFDGVTWGRYLPDLCVEASDITADGSVWLLASEEVLATYDPEAREGVPADDTAWDLYVITPEAVAVSE